MHEISEVSCSATVLRANMGGAKHRVHTDRFANFRFSNVLFLGWPLEWTSDGSASCACSSGRDVQTPQTTIFCKIITVTALFVFELILNCNDCNFHRRQIFGIFKTLIKIN